MSDNDGRERITPHDAELNAVLINEYETRVRRFREESDPAQWFNGKSFNPALMADEVVDRVLLADQVVTMGSDPGRYETLMYDPFTGIYRGDSDPVLRQIIQGALRDRAKHSRITDVINLVKGKTWMRREGFASPPHVITMINGVYDMSTGELLEWSPEFKSTRQFPIYYDPNATCPAIDKYLDEVEPQWMESGQSAKQALIEMAGYLFIDDFPIHRAFILLGDQGAGKSTYNRLLTTMLGKDNIKSFTLQALDSYAFNLGELYGKVGNLCSDIGSQALKHCGTFKALTGGDYVTAPRKYKDTIDMLWTGKMVYTCNELPPSYDGSDAFYMRIDIIEFPNVFRGTEKEDQNLLEKLTTPSELSGFFNKAIAALPGLLARKKFHNEPSLELRRLNYLRQSNTAEYFIEMALKSDPDNVISSADLYEVYRYFCHLEIGMKPKSIDAFGKTLSRAMSFGSSTIMKLDGRSRRVWDGVGVRDKYLKYVDPPQRLEDFDEPPLDDALHQRGEELGVTG